MYLTNGTLLQGGKYNIVRHISSGGFGNTYEAFDTVLNKHVAIKEFFVKDFCGRDSEKTLVTVTTPSKAPLIGHLKKKFMEEARAIANMEHENIVKVQALFEENGTAYYVMDYIDGESLNDLLKRRGSLPESEALPIVRKVGSALGYMHKQNRFHLDVKPANIMLRRDGKVILIDFGSSKQYAEVDGENTTTMAPCYTPGYAPSEQMNPKPSKFTAATDVYALGATLYKMLTGVTPPSAIDLQNEDEILSPLPQEVSSSVKECVQKALIPQRNKRLQSIQEFLTVLDSKVKEDKFITPWPLLCFITVVVVGGALALGLSKNTSSAPLPPGVDSGFVDSLPPEIMDTINDKDDHVNYSSVLDRQLESCSYRTYTVDEEEVAGEIFVYYHFSYPDFCTQTSVSPIRGRSREQFYSNDFKLETEFYDPYHEDTNSWYESEKSSSDTWHKVTSDYFIVTGTYGASMRYYKKFAYLDKYHTMCAELALYYPADVNKKNEDSMIQKIFGSFPQ